MTDRRDTRVVVGVGVILNVGGQQVPCMTRNLGRGGLFALTRTPLADGQELEVEIVHMGKKLTSPAKVASLQADGAGIEFLQPNADFETGVQALLASLMSDHGSDSGSPHDHVEARLAWAPLPDGNVWAWWRKRQHSAAIISLTLDGAALGCDKRPDLGETVLIFLGDGKSEANACRAEVVRHTESGFAVKFANPGMEFRRVVSRLRRGQGEV